MKGKTYEYWRNKNIIDLKVSEEISKLFFFSVYFWTSFRTDLKIFGSKQRCH